MKQTKMTEVSMPIGIDIGGTMTKIIFFRPIETPSLPSYVIRDDKLGDLPISRCSLLMERLDQLSGVVRFIKIPSEFVPEFVDFLVESGLSKKVCREGWSFRYFFFFFLIFFPPSVYWGPEAGSHHWWWRTQVCEAD
jgi:hypothetical protein